METRNIFFRGDQVSLLAKSKGKDKTFRGVTVMVDPLGVEIRDALGESDLAFLNNADELIVADSRRGYAFMARFVQLENGVAKLSLLGRHENRQHFRVETMLEFGYDILRRAVRSLPPEKKDREDRIEGFLSKARESDQKDNPLIAMMLYMYEEIRDLRQKVYTLSAQAESDTRSPRQYMADLSGSGIRFVTEVEHHKGDVLRFVFQLPNSPRPLTAVGKVLRADMEMGSKGSSSIACEFTEIEESDRETIIQYVFQAQRQRLKRAGNASG